MSSQVFGVRVVSQYEVLVGLLALLGLLLIIGPT